MALEIDPDNDTTNGQTNLSPLGGGALSMKGNSSADSQDVYSSTGGSRLRSPQKKTRSSEEPPERQELRFGLCQGRMYDWGEVWNFDELSTLIKIMRTNGLKSLIKYMSTRSNSEIKIDIYVLSIPLYLR